MHADIEKIKKTTVVEHVMERLKELIASGQYRVGQKLPTEQELAERFGIARSSVREAVKIFSYLGVLKSQTGPGTYVCDGGRISSEALTWSILLGQEELCELVGLRGVLERAGLQALIQASERGGADSPSAVARRQGALQSMRDALVQGDLERRIAADYDFHGTIISASGNGVFTAIYRTLRSFMYDEIRRTLAEEDPEETVRDHHALLEAVRGGDGARAREHNNSSIAGLSG